MQYFVISHDENRFGPADLALLKQWVIENRVTPQTVLEDIATSQRISAISVAGLFDQVQTATQFHNTYPPMGQQYQTPPNLASQQYVNYPRSFSRGDATVWITLSWVFSAIGIFCCPIVVSSLGIAFGFIASAQGSKNAVPAIVFGFVSLILGIAIRFLPLISSITTGF